MGGPAADPAARSAWGPGWLLADVTFGSLVMERVAFGFIA